MNGDSRELAAGGRFLRGTNRDAIRSKLACGLAFAYNASAACGVSPTTLANHIVNESTLDPTSREFQKGIRSLQLSRFPPENIAAKRIRLWERP